MHLELKRHTLTPESTIGLLSIDGTPTCSTLEDTVRPANQKVWGKTAIPAGTYHVIIDRSNRFSARAGHDVFLPLLLKVPGYEGVRIHPGNRPEDTEGCILLGVYNKAKPNWVAASQATFAPVFMRMQAALKAGQKITITIY